MNVRRRVGDDYDLWLRFSARYRFHYFADYVTEYRVMADQISSDYEARFRSNAETLREFQARFPDVMTGREFRSGWASFYLSCGRHYASHRQFGAALRSYGRALRMAPRSVGPWRAIAKLVLLRDG